MLGLVAAKAGEPSGGVEVLECPLHGFYFANLVVAVEGFEVFLFPEFAVEGFHAGGGKGGLVHVEVETEALLEVFGKAIGFWGQIAGVNPDDGNVGNDGGDEVEHDGGLDAEAGAHDGTAAKGLSTPGDDVLGCGSLKLGVQRV